MEEILEQAKEILKATTADDELFELSALVVKKYYDALLAQGFTPDQAARMAATYKIGGS